MPTRRRKRIDPGLFELPVERIRAGHFTDVYFNLARAPCRLLGAANRHPRVTWQVSAKSGGWLGGIDEAIAMLKLCTEDFSSLDVHALYEGDSIEEWDTVLLIEGDYTMFAHLETLIVGTLARRTRVCTNVRRRWSTSPAPSRSTFLVHVAITPSCSRVTATARSLPGRRRSPRTPSLPS